MCLACPDGDALFEHPRLAAVYDALEGERSDLGAYLSIVDEVDARQALDVGCGTGTFALMLAERGVDVVGLDPADASLDVARGKPGADRVRWVHGDATALPEDLEGRVDLAVMTGNVAQAIVDEQDWSGTLGAVRRSLRHGGHLVFETRRPEGRGWQEWTREQSETVADVRGHGAIRHWVQLNEVDLLLVRFETVHVFSDQTLTSSSTLRFRSEGEVVASLTSHGTTFVRFVRHPIVRAVSWSSSLSGPRCEGWPEGEVSTRSLALAAPPAEPSVVEEGRSPVSKPGTLWPLCWSNP